MTIGEKFDSNSAYGPAFDQPDHSGETKSYIICFVPRSGSWLLCDLLHASGVMGVPAEYFNMNYGAPRLSKRFGVTEIDSIPIHDYLKALKQRRTTPNGVFGVKIEARQLEPLIQANALPTHFSALKSYLSRARMSWRKVYHMKSPSRRGNGRRRPTEGKPCSTRGNCEIRSILSHAPPQRGTSSFRPIISNPIELNMSLLCGTAPDLVGNLPSRRRRNEPRIHD